MKFDDRAFHRALASSTLPATARHVAHALATFESSEGGRCFPSFAAIAEATGLGRSAVAKALKLLEDEFWVGRYHRANGAGRRSSNLFVLRVPPGEAERVKSSRAAKKASKEPRTLAKVHETDSGGSPSGGLPAGRGETPAKVHDVDPTRPPDGPHPSTKQTDQSPRGGQGSASGDLRHTTCGGEGGDRAHARGAHPTPSPRVSEKSAQDPDDWVAIKAAYQRLREKHCESSVVERISEADRDTILESIRGVVALVDSELADEIRIRGHEPPVASSDPTEAIAESMLGWWFYRDSDFLREKRYSLKFLAADIGAVEGDFREHGLLQFINRNASDYIRRVEGLARIAAGPGASEAAIAETKRLLEMSFEERQKVTPPPAPAEPQHPGVADTAFRDGAATVLAALGAR